MFDDFIMVDWSASSVPKVDADSIWLARSDGVAINYRTRHEFYEAFRGMLLSSVSEGRRVLCGFDFCFGFPGGAVAKLRRALGDETALLDWEWLWRYLALQIEDDAANCNNRWAVANEMNRLLSGGKGPFWGYLGRDSYAYLGVKKDRSITGGEFKELRITESLAPRDKSRTAMHPVWKLAYRGAVGSQSLLGIAYLQRLRCEKALRKSIAVHPFERCDRSVIFAETYYGRSTIGIDATIEPKDKAQVLGAVEFCRQEQRASRLHEWLRRPRDPRICEDEGWTFTEPHPEGMAVLAD